MKKIIISSFIFSMLICNSALCAPHHHPYPPRHHSHYHGYYGYSSSAYLVNQGYEVLEENFPDCKNHYVTHEITTYYYSDGSRRIYDNYSIYHSDGSLLIANCSYVKHLIQGNDHYFLIKNNKGYSIIDEKGQTITRNFYSKMEEIDKNVFLVKLNKKYGIIDIKENVLADIKYQKIKQDKNKLFITKLNGYYGIMNSKGKVLIKNDCEKIKKIHDAYLIKRYNKYGLMTQDGTLSVPVNQDNIKKLKEYIVVKNNKTQKLYNSKGIAIDNKEYLKIKFKRNSFFGLDKNENWVEINLNL